MPNWTPSSTRSRQSHDLVPSPPSPGRASTPRMSRQRRGGRRLGAHLRPRCRHPSDQPDGTPDTRPSWPSCRPEGALTVSSRPPRRPAARTRRGLGHRTVRRHAQGRSSLRSRSRRRQAGIMVHLTALRLADRLGVGVILSSKARKRPAPELPQFPRDLSGSSARRCHRRRRLRHLGSGDPGTDDELCANVRRRIRVSTLTMRCTRECTGEWHQMRCSR